MGLENVNVDQPRKMFRTKYLLTHKQRLGLTNNPLPSFSICHFSHLVMYTLFLSQHFFLGLLVVSHQAFPIRDLQNRTEMPQRVVEINCKRIVLRYDLPGFDLVSRKGNSGPSPQYHLEVFFAVKVITLFNPLSSILKGLPSL